MSALRRWLYRGTLSCAMCFIIALTLYNRTNHCNIRNYFISVPSMLIVSDIMFEPNYNKITESARKSLLFFNQKHPNITLATMVGYINNLKHHKWYRGSLKTPFSCDQTKLKGKHCKTQFQWHRYRSFPHSMYTQKGLHPHVGRNGKIDQTICP
jgi:hypothetical protein